MCVLYRWCCQSSLLLRPCSRAAPVFLPTNADLRVLGGLGPLVAALTDVELRSQAAQVLGVAASNNAKFQADLIEEQPDVFVLLLQVQ
jgi:hypothetical protein